MSLILFETGAEGIVKRLKKSTMIRLEMDMAHMSKWMPVIRRYFVPELFSIIQDKAEMSGHPRQPVMLVNKVMQSWLPEICRQEPGVWGSNAARVHAAMHVITSSVVERNYVHSNLVSPAWKMDPNSYGNFGRRGFLSLNYEDMNDEQSLSNLKYFIAQGETYFHRAAVRRLISTSLGEETNIFETPSVKP